MPAPKESHDEKAEVSNADKPRSRVKRIQAAWDRWEGAAARFNKLDIRLQAKQELRHITLTKYGYQVRIKRGGRYAFQRSVIGHSEESLQAAMRLRDAALRETPPAKRLHPIPPKVLRALGLTSAVLGITRWAPRSVYRVIYADATGQRRLRQFYYRVVPEEDAYAAAIAFLQTTLKEGNGRRSTVAK
jgi:hypothetical protein